MIRLLTLVVFAVSALNAVATWDVTLSTTMKNTAKLQASGSVLIHYDEGAIRSTDDGRTWSAVASLPGTVTAMTRHGLSLVAITLVSPTAPQQVLASADDGATWNVIGTATVRNNGVVYELVSTGTLLYGVSNRDEVLLSSDGGVTWTTRTYTTRQSESAVDGTVNNEGWWVLSTSGLYRSTDNGSTWEQQGVAQGASANPTQIETVNGTLFSLGLFGIRRWDPDADRWNDVSQTLPEFATLKAQIRDIRGDGAAIYAVGNTFDGVSFALVSSDNGTTWERLGDPLPSSNGVTRRALAITDRSLVVFHNGVGAAAAANGYYRMARPTTSVDDVATSSQATVYPQPASDIVTIHVPDANGRTEWTLYDVEGRVMRTAISDGTDVHLSVAGLPGGVYTVMASGNVKVRRVRVVVY